MKKILCKICLLALFVSVNLMLWAQENHTNDALPTKEFFLSGSPHTSGTSIGMDYGFIGNKLTHSIHLEFTTLRHPKEVRQRTGTGGVGGSLASVSRSFVYGKQNQLYGIHIGYGGKFHFSSKARSQGVAVNVSYAAGPSLGLVRPYYVNLRVSPEDVIPQTYTEENAVIFLDPARIAGASGLAYGWDELSFVAGGFVKFGLNFEWGYTPRLIKAVDVGVMLNIYAKEIPLMVIADNQAIFPTLYAAFQIGKRR